MIRFDSVLKKFGSRTVLSDLSFEVNTGEIFFILGKSGVGKSVTLKNIVGLMKPDSGKIFVGNIEVSALSEMELTKIRSRVGMVFQHPALFDFLTVEENVSFGLQAQPLSPKQKYQRVRESLHAVNLGEDLLKSYPPQLSEGMKKRVSIARTIAPGPEVLLFDEPTTGLDPIATRAVGELIENLSKELKTTSLVVSHDIDTALRIAHRILFLDQGSILSLGTPAEIRKSKERLIQSFMEEAVNP